MGGAIRLIDLLLPVGSVRVFVSDINPNNLYRGQTWERFAKGRTLVGVDEGDDDFVEGKSGGEKEHLLDVTEMPEHFHPLTWHRRGYDVKSDGYYSIDGSYDSGTINTGKAGGNKPHNNLPPYTTVYYWKRTE